jgi:high-affinity iron transporter
MSNASASLTMETPEPIKIGRVFGILYAIAALLVVGLLTWQGLTSGGNPDPTVANTSRSSAVFDIGVLVFREGLECILVLTAITASMAAGANRGYRRPIAAGAAVGFLATLVTWVIAARIINDLTASVPALDLQAATGLLAVVVLLVVMNWFFHKVYWGGWIAMHNRKKKELLEDAEVPASSRSKLIWGLGLLGFASLYREGFEIVLFLQSYYLKLGGGVVLAGTLVGLFFTGIVAVLNFVAHRKLPYRRMLVVTGFLLGFVLLVMVGEQAFEMQQANWIRTTNIAALKNLPDWTGVWFSVYPTVETIVAQGLAAAFVIGSYFLTRRLATKSQAG